MLATVIIFLGVGLLGAIIGSFLNVLIVRTPKMVLAIEHDDDSEHPHKIFNLAWPTSHCPHCQKTLLLRDLIPILSYVILSARCRFCAGKIAMLYPMVELTTALFALGLTYGLGINALSIAVFIFLCGILTMAVTDSQTHLVPDILSLPFLWLGLIANSYELFVPLHHAVYGAILGYGILWVIYWLYWFLRKKEGLGYGDFKLLAALGAWLGVAAIPWILLIAALAGSVWGGVQVLRQQQKFDQEIAFAPFLCMAGLLVMVGYFYLDVIAVTGGVMGEVMRLSDFTEWNGFRQ